MADKTSKRRPDPSRPRKVDMPEGIAVSTPGVDSDGEAVATRAAELEALGVSLASLKADFDVSVVYKGATYTLRILSKTPGGTDAYGILQEETRPKPSPATSGTDTFNLVEVAVKDGGNWKVESKLPIADAGMKLPGGIVLKTCDIGVSMGTATFPVRA